METIYNVLYFIKKFEAIPENDFGTGAISAHCVYWHCDYTCSYVGQIATALTEIFNKAFGITSGRNGDKQSLVYEINDGFNPSYQQPTPKQRILAALYDIHAIKYLEGVEEIRLSDCHNAEVIGETNPRCTRCREYCYAWIEGDELSKPITLEQLIADVEKKEKEKMENE